MKYYHRISGAKFYMPNGKEVAFAGGLFDSSLVKDERERADVEIELNKIANVPSSMVYTREPVADSSEAEVLREISMSATAGFDNVNKIAPGATTSALPQQIAGKPELNPGANIHTEKDMSGSNSNQAQQQPQQAKVASTTAEKIAAARKAVESAGSQVQDPTSGRQAGGQHTK